jgi:hypothetical protein
MAQHAIRLTRTQQIVHRRSSPRRAASRVPTRAPSRPPATPPSDRRARRTHRRAPPSRADPTASSRATPRRWRRPARRRDRLQAVQPTSAAHRRIRHHQGDLLSAGRAAAHTARLACSGGHTDHHTGRQKPPRPPLRGESRLRPGASSENPAPARSRRLRAGEGELGSRARIRHRRTSRRGSSASWCVRASRRAVGVVGRRAAPNPGTPQARPARNREVLTSISLYRSIPFAPPIPRAAGSPLRE